MFIIPIYIIVKNDMMHEPTNMVSTCLWESQLEPYLSIICYFQCYNATRQFPVDDNILCYKDWG